MPTVTKAPPATFASEDFLQSGVAVIDSGRECVRTPRICTCFSFESDVWGRSILDSFPAHGQRAGVCLLVVSSFLLLFLTALASGTSRVESLPKRSISGVLSHKEE